jgi:hypothetical protein
MDTQRLPMTRLAAVVAGALAGAVGTACMDTIRHLLYRRGGGMDSALAWEFPRVDSWEKAPDPGQVAKREIEGFTQRELPDCWAGLISTVAHWAYGSAWGAAYGVVAGSLRHPHPLYGLPFGALGLGQRLHAPPGGGALQTDLGVRREDPRQGPDRASRLRSGHRHGVLAARPMPVASAAPLRAAT